MGGIQSSEAGSNTNIGTGVTHSRTPTLRERFGALYELAYESYAQRAQLIGRYDQPPRLHSGVGGVWLTLPSLSKRSSSGTTTSRISGRTSSLTGYIGYFIEPQKITCCQTAFRCEGSLQFLAFSS